MTGAHPLLLVVPIGLSDDVGEGSPGQPLPGRVPAEQPVLGPGLTSFVVTLSPFPWLTPHPVVIGIAIAAAAASQMIRMCRTCPLCRAAHLRLRVVCAGFGAGLK